MIGRLRTRRPATAQSRAPAPAAWGGRNALAGSPAPSEDIPWGPRGFVRWVTAGLGGVADPAPRMRSAPHAFATGSPRVRHLLVALLGAWVLLSTACATTSAPGAGTLYGAPRTPDGFAAAPPLPATGAPDAAPILDESPVEPSSLFLAREILADRAPELDELQREGVARAVVKAEQEHGLPALLVLALIEQESQFRPKVRGPAGAVGLMQVMPSSGREIATRHGITWHGFRTLHDPVKNVHLGILYLAEMRERFDSVELAMAAYNIGPGAVERRLARGLSCRGPYVTGVQRRFQAMRLIFGDPTTAIGG
jgi:Transglycosylase SLT domain